MSHPDSFTIEAFAKKTLENIYFPSADMTNNNVGPHPFKCL
jgi:hypothetical protein